MTRTLIQLLPLFVLGCAVDGITRDAPGEEDAVRMSVGTARIGVTDQGENSTDLSITRRIRRAVMREDRLSFSAKNAKIITRDGHVTLQGRLNSSRERDVLLATAQSVAGRGRVDDQLRIKD